MTRQIQFVCIFLIAMLFSTIGWAQEVKQEKEFVFIADRPGATTSPDVMPKKTLNWETGTEIDWERTSGSTDVDWTINNSLFRYGLTDYAEVRFGIDESYVSTAGISKLYVGTKIKVFDGFKALPKVALLGGLLLPDFQKNTQLPERLGGEFHLLFNNPICSWFSFGYDVGVLWPGTKSRKNIYDEGTLDRESIFLGCSFDFQPADIFSCYIEQYNSFDENSTNMIEVGAALMVHRRVQIDVYSDFNLRGINQSNSIGFGVAWKIL